MTNTPPKSQTIQEQHLEPWQWPEAHWRKLVDQVRGGRTLRAGDEIITFVNRNLEPMRGYHVFMRSLPEILRARPNAVVLIVGGDEVSYGASPPAGKTWKQIFLDEVKADIDMKRVLFLGRVAYADYLRVLQVSACHNCRPFSMLLNFATKQKSQLFLTAELDFLVTWPRPS